MSDFRQPHEIESYRTKSHTVGGHTLSVEGVRADTGAQVTFDSIRKVEVNGMETYTSSLLTWDKEANEIISEVVALPKRLHVLGENTLHLLKREKGKFITVGSIVLTLAAGAGIIVKRHHSKG